MSLFETYVQQQRVRFAAELARFCRQPSIASTGEGMQAMADIVADRLLHLGAVTRTYYVDNSYPYIVAEIGSGPRTLLLYNHYDVQPARFEDGWTHHPFEAIIEHGRLFARGVADNKANLLFRIHAIEAFLAAYRDLPIRIRFLVEGEEEIGSPHLTRFIRQHTPLVQADGCLWESGRKDAAGRPLIQLGLRGICYLELTLQADSREVHSSWANIAENPAMHLLARMQAAVASLTDPTGRPTFGGLLEAVLPPSPADLALLEQIPFDLAAIQERLGVLPRIGLNGSSSEALRRLFFEPTCTLCGFKVGYGEPGTKTVIPNRAVAKLDMRLPSGLTPDDVEQRLRDHLHAHGFGDIQVRRLGGLRPSRTAPDAAIVRATQAAVEAAYGIAPVVHPMMSASGPMYDLCEAQGIPAVTFGAGHSGDNTHGVDENIVLDDYFQAISAMGEIIRRFGAEPLGPTSLDATSRGGL
jgi:acetylornithine deacetylase/succinyl-diaminopimelate desuccinylase-like protein